MRLTAVLLLATLSMTFAACRKEPPRPEEQLEDRRAATPAIQTVANANTKAPAEFKLPAPTEPGYAYFNFVGGVAAFEPSGTVSLVQGTPKNASLADLSLSPEGIAYAMSNFDTDARYIYRFEGTNLVKFASTKQALGKLNPGREGRLYLVYEDKVETYDPKTKNWSIDTIPGAKYAETAYEDSKGRIWVNHVEGLAYREGGAWKDFESAFFSTALFCEAGGELLLLGSNQVSKIENGKATPFGPKYTAGGSALSCTVNGILALPDYDSRENKASTLLMLANGTTQRIDTSVTQARLDTAGRLWSSNDGAVTVTSPNGQATVYPLGSVPALSELSGLMFPSSFVVTGAGPKLPPVGPVQKATAVKGTLIRGGKPIANSDIEICAWAERRSNGSPCAGKASRMATKTNEKGEFVFTDVPLGNYDLAILQPTGKWAIDTLTDIQRLVAGKEKNVGTVRYEEKTY